MHPLIFPPAFSWRSQKLFFETGIALVTDEYRWKNKHTKNTRRTFLRLPCISSQLYISIYVVHHFFSCPSSVNKLNFCMQSGSSNNNSLPCNQVYGSPERVVVFPSDPGGNFWIFIICKITMHSQLIISGWCYHDWNTSLYLLLNVVSVRQEIPFVVVTVY